MECAASLRDGGRGAEVVAVSGDCERCRRGGRHSCGEQVVGHRDGAVGRGAEGHVSEVDDRRGGGNGGFRGVEGDRHGAAVVVTVAGYEEVVGPAVEELIVVPAGRVDAIAGNPHPVARRGVGDAEVVDAGRNGDGGRPVHHDVGGGQAAVGIGGDCVLELRIDGRGGVAACGQGASGGNNRAVGVVVSVQQKLVATAVLPHIVGLQNDCHLCFRTECQRYKRDKQSKNLFHFFVVLINNIGLFNVQSNSIELSNGKNTIFFNTLYL